MAERELSRGTNLFAILNKEKSQNRTAIVSKSSATGFFDEILPVAIELRRNELARPVIATNQRYIGMNGSLQLNQV